ncbi:MAG: translocation and assembly module TamA [Rhodoferax sp.]|jgi:translocation and assembly module TamA
MTWLVAGALLLGSPLLWAQSAPPSPATPASAAAPANVAFALNIEAPDDIKALLERHLELQRYRELTDLNDSELTRLVASARENTRDLLATLGYFAPDIQLELVTGSTPGARVVRLRVAPGEPTKVETVAIEFSGPIATDDRARNQRQQIKDSWSLHQGMRFTQAIWASAKQQVLRQLTTQRYPVGQLSTTLADIDPLSHRAHLTLVLDSGPAYRLGTLEVSGLQRFKPELVTHLARLQPGAEYTQTQLVEAQQRLTDSGYFDSVFVSLDTTGDPNAALVRVQLREALVQKIVLGVGVSTDSGPRLTLEHTHNQLPILGWRATSKVLLDRNTQSIGSELLAPPNEDNWRWVTSALVQRQQSGSFDVSSQRLRGGRSKTEAQFDRSYFLQYDRAETAATSSAMSELAQSLSANYAFTLRRFNNLAFPTQGWGLGLELGGGTTLGSQQDPYGRLLARMLRYQPLGSSDNSQQALRAGRIALRAEAGAVIAKEGITLPSTQLFLTGGDNTVRGYGLRDIGVTLPNDLITPGRYRAVGSVEWQRPIVVNDQMTDWESTVFMDVGAVANQPSELQAKVGIGAGVRWRSPVGPLQIDLAYGVQTQRLRLHLNVGFNF